MHRLGAAVLITCALADVAVADDHCPLYDRLWPSLPAAQRLTLSQQITDELTELGNTLGQHLDTLTSDMLVLQFDGRRRRARIRVGSDQPDSYLTFKLASDVHFTQGVARITAKLDLGVAGHIVSVELPDVEMAPASYRGERGVEIRLPLFRRSF